MNEGKPRVPVSCFLITCNEEEVLANALESVVDLVDEIVVVDSGSSDRTHDIAGAFGARVIERPWSGFGRQKQFAEQACRNDWVLNIDADEAVSPELADEIRALFAAGAPTCALYAVPRFLVYPGRVSPAFARRDAPIRLYDRRVGGFSDADVHEGVLVKCSKVLVLKRALLHYAAKSVLHVTQKNLAYAGLSATSGSWTKRSLVELYARLLFEFPVVFVRTYVFRGHALNGAQGFAMAMSVAFTSFMKVVSRIEGRGLWVDPGPGFKRLPD